MGFSIDYKELSAYVSSITVMKKDFHKFLRKFLLEMAERILARVKPRTPVDTGELRRSWELGEISGEGENISIEILNGMDYASFIELGHRIVSNGVEVGWYEGRFMLRISIDEVRKQMPLRYEKEFKTFCMEHNLII